MTVPRQMTPSFKIKLHYGHVTSLGRNSSGQRGGQHRGLFLRVNQNPVMHHDRQIIFAIAS